MLVFRMSIISLEAKHRFLLQFLFRFLLSELLALLGPELTDVVAGAAVLLTLLAG